MEFYRQRLNPKEQELYDAMYKAFKTMGDKVTAPAGLEKESVLACHAAVKYDHPELFYVNYFTIWSREYTDHYDYFPKYWYSAEETEKKKNEIRDKLNAIVADMRRSGAVSVYERCKWLHDYLARECTYDNASCQESKKQNETCAENYKDAYTIEGFLYKKTAVCQGISLLYSLLCRMAGIDVITAYGRSIDPRNKSKEYGHHAWNIVCVGDAAAQIDVTWDMCFSTGENIRYDYFFLPDLEMMRDHQYVKYPSCGQLKSSYFERMGTQFTDTASLGKYVEREIRRWRRERKSDAAFLHFKMKNARETQEEIKDFVIKSIRSSIDVKWQYTEYVNELHSVYLYKVESSR